MSEHDRILSSYSELMRLCQRASEKIRGINDILVASHVDADGLTAASIVCSALARAGIEYHPLFFRQLDDVALRQIADYGSELVIFTDLGSGIVGDVCRLGLNAIIIDHHKPASSQQQPLVHINPHLVGSDGATQLSASGVSFIFAYALASNGKNNDLSPLAIVGAVGDLQDLARGELIGINRKILEIGAKSGAISFARDIRLFGRQTRPVYKMLEYSQDPYLPGLSGNEDACVAFLKETGIRLGGERWRRWIDLEQEEKARVVSAIIRRGLRDGISNVKLERLIGEVYTLLRENEGTELRDASEYSTLLNATARYGFSEIGLKVCLGDREKAFERSRVLLGQHRQNLVKGLKVVNERGITALKNIQYFDAGNEILDTIIGIVAGMCFQMADRSRPILAFARTQEGNLKVSARGTQDLVRSGLDLAEAISNAAERVGGIGGGHNIAAGATIPSVAKEEFLELVDTIIGLQLDGTSFI